MTDPTQPDVAAPLVEAYAGSRLVRLRLLDTRRIEWSSPVFWYVRFEAGDENVYCIYFDNAQNKWQVKLGWTQSYRRDGTGEEPWIKKNTH